MESLKAYYERWYRPDLMAVVAVGDFDVEDIEAKVKQYFAPPPEGEAGQKRAAAGPTTDRPLVEVPGHEIPLIEVFTDPESPATQFVLIRKLDPETGRDLAAFRRTVVERLAFMMLNARLFERGQSAEPPYINSSAGRSAYVETLDIATFSAWVETGGVEAGLAAMLEEIQRAHQHSFTAGELEREKSNLLSSVESQYKQREQTPSSALSDEYTDHFFSGSPVPGIEAEWQFYQELLPQISLAEFADVAESWAQTENLALLVVRPEETDGAGADDALGAALLTQLQTAHAIAVEPYADDLGDVPLLANVPKPGTIAAEERIESIGAVKWTLSNGITVIAKQTDFRDDEVLFRAFSPGGHSLVTDEDHLSARYAAQLVAGSGAGPHDSVTLDKLLAGKRVTVAPYIEELFEGFSGNASPEDLETLFQLITLHTTEHRLDPDFFTRYEARLHSVAEFRAADPDSVFLDYINTVLSQGHHHGRPLSVEVLEELNMETAEAVYSDRFADLGDATFVFVGAFDWDTLRSLTTGYLAALPSAGRAEEWRDVGLDPPAGVVDEVVRSGLEPRSRTILLYAGDMDWSRQEALTIHVAGEILGIRLRERGARGARWRLQHRRQHQRHRAASGPRVPGLRPLRQRPRTRRRAPRRGVRPDRLAEDGRRAEVPGHRQGAVPDQPPGAAEGERILARTDPNHRAARRVVRRHSRLRRLAGCPDARAGSSRGRALPHRRPLPARRPPPRGTVARPAIIRPASSRRLGPGCHPSAWPGRSPRADRPL